MNSRLIAGVACAAMLWSAAFAALADDSAYAPQKVVYQVNDYGGKQQTGALRNVQNYINAVGVDKLEMQARIAELSKLQGEGFGYIKP